MNYIRLVFHMIGLTDFKDSTRRRASDEILRIKAFNIAKILNMMDFKEVLLQWSITFLIKNLLVESLRLHGRTA